MLGWPQPRTAGGSAARLENRILTCRRVGSQIPGLLLDWRVLASGYIDPETADRSKELLSQARHYI